MAGDWLKVEANTPEKEEVLAITAQMGWDDSDMTVGKLFRLWRWFDQHTINGNARTVTPALLDRIVGVTGFCEAVRKVGWLEITEAGITLPKFDRHNGKTAKSRALTAKRVAKHKSSGNGEGNASSVSNALPREEKSKELKPPVVPLQGTTEYTEAFEAAWSSYPKRAGTNSKAKAFKAWCARLRENKSSAEAMAAGVLRYRRFCETTGKIGTEFVMQASRFFGPDKHFQDQWPKPDDSAPDPRAELMRGSL